MPGGNADAIDRLVGIGPGSHLHAIRLRRPEARTHAQASYRALFAPDDPGHVTPPERFAVGTFVAGLHGAVEARAFYAVIIVGTLAGLSFNFIGINPIQALVFTAVFNGLAAVPLIFILARLSSSEKLLGDYRGRLWSKLGLWSAWVVMTVAAGALLISFL